MTGVINSDVKPPDWKREAKSYLADGPAGEKEAFPFSCVVFSQNSTLSSRYLVALMKSSFHSRASQGPSHSF